MGISNCSPSRDESSAWDGQAQAAQTEQFVLMGCFVSEGKK